MLKKLFKYAVYQKLLKKLKKGIHKCKNMVYNNAVIIQMMIKNTKVKELLLCQ